MTRRSFRRWYLGATLPYAILLSLWFLLDEKNGDKAFVIYVGINAVVCILLASWVGFAAEARGRWLIGPLALVLLLAVISGGPSGIVLYAPLFTILLWLMLRRSQFA